MEAHSEPARCDESRLSALVRDFDRDPVESRRLIRELVEDPERFYAAAVEVVKAGGRSRGYRCLISLLIGRSLLLRALCDSAVTRGEATALARKALEIDPSTDLQLANFVAGSDGSEMGGGTKAMLRLIDILGDISTLPRFLPALRRMVRHPDPQLRAKAVLMIGRGDQAISWIQNRLAESDPRIRANAVEALWDANTEDARSLLKGAVLDANNRVAGNAILALCRMGDAEAVPELLKMSERSSPLFRSTAAWVMGEAAEPEFGPVLARMLGDPDPVVRKRAFAALGRLKGRRSSA